MINDLNLAFEIANDLYNQLQLRSKIYKCLSYYNLDLVKFDLRKKLVYIAANDNYARFNFYYIKSDLYKELRNIIGFDVRLKLVYNFAITYRK